MSSILEFLLNLFGKRSKSGSRYYQISETLHVSLSTLAQQEGRSEHDLFPDIVAAGLDRYRSFDDLVLTWKALSPREQDVAALTCLGLTNRQIAAQLSLSPETIKTHIHNMLAKFGLNSKEELRQLLEDWNFDAWL